MDKRKSIILLIIFAFVIALLSTCSKGKDDRYAQAICKIIDDFQLFEQYFIESNIEADLLSVDTSASSLLHKNETMLSIMGSDGVAYHFYRNGMCEIELEKHISSYDYVIWISTWFADIDIGYISVNDVYCRIDEQSIPIYLGSCYYANGNFKTPVDDTVDLSYDLLPVLERTYEDVEEADMHIKEAFTVEELEKLNAETMRLFELIIQISEQPVKS